MSAIPTLRAPGVVLRPLTLADAPAMFEAHGDERTHRFWSSPAHGDVEETRRYLQDTLEAPEALVWAVTDEGGEAMGRLALFRPRAGVGEFGIIMRPVAQGRGLAGKALALACAFAFDTLGLHRLVADIDPDNAASLALFQGAGFHREALLKCNWITHIGMRDTVLMVKLRDDIPDAQRG